MLFFLFVKSYAGWEVCGLASHLHVFCFQSEGGSKKFEDWQGLKNFRTGGGSTDFFFEGGVTFTEGEQYPIICHAKLDMSGCHIKLLSNVVNIACYLHSP